MLVARNDEQIVGTAALEMYADGALLRSVAVEPHLQGRQLGHQLTDAALHLASSRGATTVFLLTTTAERFFPGSASSRSAASRCRRPFKSRWISIGVSGFGDRHAEAAG